MSNFGIMQSLFLAFGSSVVSVRDWIYQVAALGHGHDPLRIKQLSYLVSKGLVALADLSLAISLCCGLCSVLWIRAGYLRTLLYQKQALKLVCIARIWYAYEKF